MVLQNGTFAGSVLGGPLRPQKGPAKLERQHPYRKMRQVIECRSPPVVATAVSLNGSGHHSHVTLTPGLLKPLGGEKSEVDIYQLMEQVAAGSLDPTSAAVQVRDLHSGAEKEKVRGWEESCMPDEIVWAPGKSAPQIAYALQRLAQRGFAPMAARVSSVSAKEIEGILPESKYNEVANTVSLPPGGSRKPIRLPGTVAVVCDGTAEAGVAEETKVACAALGCYAFKLAGTVSNGPGQSSVPPNLIAAQSADVVIVISGVHDRAALPSLIASSVSSPVVLVPVGKLDSAPPPPPGVTVVESRNGIAAAIFAARILKSSARLRPGCN